MNFALLLRHTYLQNPILFLRNGDFLRKGEYLIDFAVYIGFNFSENFRLIWASLWFADPSRASKNTQLIFLDWNRIKKVFSIQIGWHWYSNGNVLAGRNYSIGIVEFGLLHTKRLEIKNRQVFKELVFFGGWGIPTESKIWNIVSCSWKTFSGNTCLPFI